METLDVINLAAMNRIRKPAFHHGGGGDFCFV